jgi:hypothetical protein
MARPGNAQPGPAARPAAPRAGPGTPLAGRGAVLTGRGAMLAMAVVFLIGLLAAALLGRAVVAGLAFVLGCVLAARYARPADLLTVTVGPPVVLAGTLLFVRLVTGSGGLLLSGVMGSVVTLVAIAPWLAAGMVLTVIIAWARGLPECIKDLRQALRSARRGTGDARVAAQNAHRPGAAQPAQPERASAPDPR